MEDNIINHPLARVIINGGNPEGDCPTDWDKAKDWEEKANDMLDENGPQWSWDCGFKLDFDGPLARVSSRFYPPKSHYGPKWDGYLSIYVMDKKVIDKKFEKDTLEELKKAVEGFVINHFGAILKSKS